MTDLKDNAGVKNLFSFVNYVFHHPYKTGIKMKFKIYDCLPTLTIICPVILVLAVTKETREQKVSNYIRKFHHCGKNINWF